jgi:hypothetical protein
LGVVAELKTRASEESLQFGASGELRGVQHLEPGPRPPLLPREVLEEPDVERGVVRHEHAPCRELEEGRQGGLDRGRVGDHAVADPGEDRDERRDLGVRVDQRLELAEDLAAANLHRPDLGDHRATSGRAAGRLEVDDAEGEVAQGSAQLVEAALRLPAGGRNRNGAGHGLDARAGRRQSAGRRAE